MQQYHKTKMIQKETRVYRTSGIPHLNLTKHEGKPINIDQYQSLVGQILFLTTKVGLKTGAAVRALSAHMSNPGPSQWKAIKRSIGYLKDLKFKGVLYLEIDSFHTILLVDTNYANCKETRRSIRSSINTVGGCLVDGETPDYFRQLLQS